MSTGRHFPMQRLFRDIRFWLLLFFLLRLYGITLPPLEVGHNWRQTTVAMVARNFYELGPDIFHPRVDFAGDKSGITGMEFPFFNYLIYLLSTVFGYHDWFGRLINLVVSTIGAWYFYRLAKRYFGQHTAFYATLALSCSIWFSIARKIMPDTFSVALVIVGLFYGTAFLENAHARWRNLLLYTIFTFLGILSKLPAGYLLVALLPLLLDWKVPFWRKAALGSVSCLYMVPVMYWYFAWVPYLVQHYGFYHFFMGFSLAEGAQFIFSHLLETGNRFLDTALKYVGFAFFVYGLFQAFRQGNKRLLVLFALLFAVFLVIIFKAGFAFYHHSYYIVPFVPAMALVCGYGIAQLPRRAWRVVVIAAICLEGILNQWTDFRIKDNDKGVLKLESDLNRFPDGKVIINSGKYPTPMYFAHRKGWIVYNAELGNTDSVVAMNKAGARYIIVLKKTFGTDTVLNYPKVVVDNADYTIYYLGKYGVIRD